MPDLVNPEVPASTTPRVVIPALTVTVGAAPASVSGPALLGLRNQLCLVALRSSKVRLPIVRATSRVTLASAVRWSVPKSAVLPEPSAMVPALQLPALVQLPPL